MKVSSFVVIIFVLFSAGCIIYVPSDFADDTYYSSYGSDWDMNQIYDYLSPHGYWTRMAPYGYVWVPTGVRYHWRPYTDGRWVWSDYGWMWISNYTWGWIPFHYGRWGYDQGFGWFWVPGDIWSPAWVSWRYSSLYIGWAPIPPDLSFSPGIGVIFRGRTIPHRYWVFTQGRYFNQYNINTYILPYERNLTIMNMTVQKTSLQMQDNRVINKGLDVNFVEKVTKSRIRKYDVVNSGRAESAKIEGDRITVFNPKFSKEESGRPEKLLNEREVEERVERRINSRISDLKEAEIKRRQNQEIQRIESTQQKEVIEMRRKMEQEEAEVRSKAQKARIEREYKQKIKKLKESHTKEKKSVKQRHETETKKVKKKKKK
ncbi:MAG: hypothetical protein GF421_10385 [Candidatus Aminicenantes bacterium]|nr:hypothetical protein [Candidatus Aminicenantes bacterium]